MMARFLLPVLSAQFMTPILTIILNLASSWSLSWTSSSSWILVTSLDRESLPAVGHALFTRCGSALFTCRRFLLLVLLWTPLCSRLSAPVSASRVHHRTFSHVLRHNFPSEAVHNTPSHRLRLAEPPHALSEVSDLRGRLPTLSSAWSWIPPCHVWSTFARRWNCLVVGVCASKVCTQTAFCTFRQALLCSASRDRALVCSGSSCFRRHPSQVINLSTDTIVPQLFPLRLALVWLCPLRPPGRAPTQAQ